MAEYINHYIAIVTLLASIFFVLVPFKFKEWEGNWTWIVKIAAAICWSVAVGAFSLSAYAASFVIPAGIIKETGIVVAFVILFVAKEYKYYLKQQNKEHY